MVAATDVEKDAGFQHEYRTGIHAATTIGTEKNVGYLSDTESNNVLLGAVEDFEVKRTLKTRHIAMIALGGTIGTGLFIGMGTTLSEAGPVPALISYIFMTSLAYSITQSLGEMATYVPVTGSFNQFIGRWCSPALGAANGINYWFSWAITFALEISIVGQVIEYWTDAVPLAAWIGIFLVLLTAINLVPVKFYGEIEFWIASIKIIAITGWLIYALCTVCGTGKTGPIGFRYWRNPGPWGDGILVSNKNTGRFLAWLSSLITAAFTFQGCELVALTAGEASSPQALPKAIKKVFYRIILFYILSLFFMGLLVPFNDPKLSGDDESYAMSSPFIIAIVNAGTPVLPDIFNAVILMTIVSAGNSNVYSGSRILYALAEAKLIPKIFALTNKHGVPWVSVLFTAAFGALGFLVVSEGGSTVFDWLLNITAVAGLITWGWISYCHLRFMKILKFNGIARDSLPFKAHFMPGSAHYATWAIFILVFIQGYSCFFDITASSFFTAYISVILFVFTWICFHFWFNGFTKKAFTWGSLLIPIEDCDIVSGVRGVDDDCWTPEPIPTNLWEKFWAFIC
ncbi:probable lysine/arginine permease Can3p [[Candida] railenensis]|uniref:Probable lysine/arginine permease Can3p n=1 Tax=[Candida] railenensis TaxID=45579 RepID=A0A9P0VWH7_9ASCO|nr:probable lysine/arginine permease Can3p [[Candida] railenensis]